MKDMKIMKKKNNNTEFVYEISFAQALFNPPFIFILRLALSFMVIVLAYGSARSSFLLDELFHHEWYIAPILYGVLVVFMVVISERNT